MLTDECIEQVLQDLEDVELENVDEEVISSEDYKNISENELKFAVPTGAGCEED
jgi:hypothetical protein